MAHSVIGCDVGNDTSCVAMARKRGVDVLLNKESTRETPSVVSFDTKMRFLGTDGLAKMGLAPQNTISQLKRLLGRKFKDAAVQVDIQKFPFNVTEAPDGGCMITVQFQGEQQTFTPEQAMAMVMVDLKKIAEKESGVPPVDCVLSVPVFYDEPQRYAMLNAAHIAGLNCLRILNETTATALAYGIFKTDLPETEPVHVAFVDVGHSSTQVAVVSFKKTGLHMRGHAWDESIGGREFDEVLFDHFCDEFKAKNKIDIRSNKKASFKLRVQCGKAKKILSANAEASIAVECIIDDVDVKAMITREQFEAMIEPSLVRFKGVLQQALARSGIPQSDISSVEVVGSSTRIPCLARIVEEVFGKPPSRTMNAKECVSRGCALQCAMLSPVFKVREFEVIDTCPHSVEFQWEKDGETTSQVLFEAGSPFPAAKMLTFLRSEPFTIHAINKEAGTKLAEYRVGPFAIPPGAERAKLKVKVRMNLHGIISVESAQAIEEEEVPVATASTTDAPEAKMEDAAAAGPDAGDAAAGPTPMEAEAGAPAADAPAAPAAGGKEKKKKVKKTDVPVQVVYVTGLSQNQLDLLFERECQMASNDRLMEETADRKNAVESYLYKLRNGLYGSLEPYASSSEKDKVLAQLQACEDWLYDEGEDCSKSVYVAKLEELQALGNPIMLRQSEDEARPAAITALRTSAESYLSFASSTEPRFAHITPEEREVVAKEAQAALAWLSDKVAQQSQLKRHDPPVLLSADIQKKMEVLDRVARPIATKPVPKPAPVPTPAPAAAPPPAADEPMEADMGPVPPPAEGEAAGDAPMEGAQLVSCSASVSVAEVVSEGPKQSCVGNVCSAC